MTTLATMFSGGGVFCADLPAEVVPIWGIEHNSAVADIYRSIPDRYWLPDKVSLACTVVGNGVPSLIGRILVESFL